MLRQQTRVQAGLQGLCARLAQSVERQALNLMVVGSSPTVGAVFLLPHLLPAV